MICTIPTGRDKVEDFTGFLKQNKIINKTVKMRSLWLRSQSRKVSQDSTKPMKKSIRAC